MWDGYHLTRDAARAYEIAGILVRHGWGDLVQRTGLAAALRRAGRLLPLAHVAPPEPLPAATRVRMAMEALGPTFVKLGQILATRVDLFPPDWIAEFERLQSHVPAVPYDAIRAQLTEDLGAPPDAVFLRIDPAPLAAASIAQVHRAQLHDGTQVVVKVRRPGIRPVIEADLRLMQRAAAAIHAHMPELRAFHLPEVVEQFRQSLLRELDLAAECRHAERIAAAFAGDAALVVPAVRWDYTSERVNVQDWIDGIPIADIAALERAGIDRRALARAGAQAILRMMLLDGFFHADPHPGNVFALSGNRIALIDFGMVGRLSRRRRGEVIALLHGLVERDATAVAEVLLDWAGREATDERRLQDDVDAFIDRYHGVTLDRLDLAGMLLDTTVLLRQHRLALPPDLALMVKVCITLEGLGRSLDGEFDMAGEAAPFLRHAMRARYAPRAVAGRSLSALAVAGDLLADAPRTLRALVRAARAGKVRIHLDLEQLQAFGRQVDHSANRLAMGLVLAALIVGSSITMTVAGGPTLWGLPTFGLLGFIGAVLAATWLLVSIWRSGGGK
ncbi:ABC1 kinase family protein [Chiayiivirga flava]|uniref:Ubiquinone biosynthesis protein n=1 Tax=Chiayiivirga flava TaxID=659595 RepID=A0A7W8D303_9GAMM|nr:AarF/UbiB family protein [Chiayiivirga flava]MBB5206547.1 ubiquinone biosynthesis protein [Chiayiivirga flava]